MNADLVRLERRQARRRRLVLLAERRMAMALRPGSAQGEPRGARTGAGRTAG